MTKLTKILLLAGAGAALWYVPTILALMNITVKIISVLPTNIDGNKVDFLVTVKLKNNSRFRVNIQKIMADVLLNGTKIAQFGRLQQIPILPNSDQNINVSFTVDAKVVGDELWQELLAQNLQNFVLDVTGSLTANNKILPFTTNWTINDFVSGIGGIGELSAEVKKKFNHYFNEKDFELVEPYGNLWKSRGKELYIKSKGNYTATFQYLERQPFIKKVYEAGGDEIICVILK